uniref:helix-turn-helix domain-containing protein n=1 Tax=Bacillus smithii TaxID=1479 RepID=UPI0022E2F5DC
KFKENVRILKKIKVYRGSIPVMKDLKKLLDTYPDVLTVMEVKELLGIGREQTYNLVNSDKFPVQRVGRRILIYKPNLIKWLENNTAD